MQHGCIHTLQVSKVHKKRSNEVCVEAFGVCLYNALLGWMSDREKYVKRRLESRIERREVSFAFKLYDNRAWGLFSPMG